MWTAYRTTVARDLRRYSGDPTLPAFLRHVALTPGFKYAFWMRTARLFKGFGRLALPLYVASRWVLKHYTFKYGISIPYNTAVGPGLYIGHFGGIVVNYLAVIGEDCNINHDVTIGVTYGGRHEGAPRIGDRVFLGPGAKVVGGIQLGNDVAVGANCVVTTSVPDDAVVVGIPGKVVSQKGSGAYVVNTGSRRAVDHRDVLRG
jgi:serine O-acetyltransferase